MMPARVRIASVEFGIPDRRYQIRYRPVFQSMDPRGTCLNEARVDREGSMKRMVSLVLLCLVLPCAAGAQEAAPVGVGDWLTASANVDGGFRRTQFFDPRYDTGVLS